MKISDLEWDDKNLEHIIGRHGISPKEVEDVCFGPHYACSAKYRRKAIYGQSSSGKYIMVILEQLYVSVFRPITARGMKNSEKRKYQTIIGEEK
jgi:uncharacterized DUF497 family protein